MDDGRPAADPWATGDGTESDPAPNPVPAQDTAGPVAQGIAGPALTRETHRPAAARGTPAPQAPQKVAEPAARQGSPGRAGRWRAAGPEAGTEPGEGRGEPSLAETVQAIFAPGGLLERLVPGYQHRPGQVEMALEVAAALEESHHLAVEAATGIGKSLAYLIPAALWAHRRRTRVVVATHTLALQDQLRARDLPIIERIVPVQTAVLKGFAQYACRLQAAAVLEELAGRGPDLWAATRAAPPAGPASGAAPNPGEALAEWMEATASGELAELADPALARLAQRLAVDAGACLGAGCPAVRRCFPLLAREQAQGAALIVTNHALLFADWASGGRLLPSYDALICDEAHHLEDVAAQQLGCRLNPGELLRALGTARSTRRSRGTGGLPRARGDAPRQEAGSLGVGPEQATALEGLILLPGASPGGADGGSSSGASDSTQPALVSEARAALERLDAALEAIARPAGGGPVRLPEGWHRGDGPATLGSLARALDGAGDALASLATELEQQPPPVEERAFLAFRRLRQQVQEAATAIQRLLEHRDLCTWVEAHPGGPQLVAAPVVAAGALEPLFASVPTVLASATLPRDDHWLQRLGMDAVRRRFIPSPFDLASQALLAVVTDAPRPPSHRDEAYAGALARQLLPVIGAIPGGVLVLFTARWALEAVGERLRPALRALGRRPALQDRDGPRSRLVAALATGELDVLMGVDSLWEGIDVPGRHLEGVILTRIPFDSPGDPLTAARCDAINAAGGSAFFQYQLPRAAVKLKQGFGRLIRGPADRGVVVVLDPRLAPGSSRYAPRLLDSLPPATRWVGTAADLVDMVTAWFARPGPSPAGDPAMGRETG